MLSMWSVKVRPKIRSWGSRIFLGVVVLVIVRADGSMSGREESLDCWVEILEL